MLYELHMTVGSQAPIPANMNLRESIFSNISRTGEEVSRERLLSISWGSDADPNRQDYQSIVALQEAQRQVNEVHSCGMRVKRWKLETHPPIVYPYATLYYEGHVRLKEGIDLKILDYVPDYVYVSKNIKSGIWWLTVRSKSREMVRERYLSLLDWANGKVSEREIESVIVDTYPQADREWITPND